MRSTAFGAAGVAVILAFLVEGCQTTESSKIITQQQSLLAFDESGKILSQAPKRENHSTAQTQVEAYLWPGGGIYYVEAFPGYLFRTHYSDAEGLKAILTKQFSKLKLATADQDVAFARNRFGSFPYVIGRQPDGRNCFVFSQTLQSTVDDATGNRQPSRIYVYGGHCAAPAVLGEPELKAEMLRIAESLRNND